MCCVVIVYSSPWCKQSYPRVCGDVTIILNQNGLNSGEILGCERNESALIHTSACFLLYLYCKMEFQSECEFCGEQCGALNQLDVKCLTSL